MNNIQINHIPESLKTEISARVSNNLSLHKLISTKSKTEKYALSCLFSELYYLEEIAVMAALRGDSIDGQLEDEFVHRETFRSLAEMYGELQLPSNETVDLLSFLSVQQGEISLAMLNVVAESWLETVFDQMSNWGICDDIFEIIEQDEQRHVHDALQSAIPPVSQSQPIVNDLEVKLSNIMSSPQFTLPMIYLGGLRRSANIGLAICRAHVRACEHLGVNHDVRDIVKSCRAQILRSQNNPTPIEMNKWERSKQNLWNNCAPMQGYFDCKVPFTSPARNKMVLIKSISEVLQANPKFCRTLRNKQLFQTENIVGFRFQYEDDMISTAYVRNGWKQDMRKLIKHANRSVKKIKRAKYLEVPDLTGYIDLLPPSRCPVVLNYNDGFGYNVTGPLNDVEAVPIQVMVGQVQEKQTTVSVTMDHRVFDGQDISEFGEKLYKRMMVNNEKINGTE